MRIKVFARCFIVNFFMKKISIKQTDNERWNRVSSVLNGEIGVIHEKGITDGVTLYRANFPVYGAYFIDIPESVCEIIEEN